MAGNRQKKSCFSFFSMFKLGRSRNMMEDSYMSAERVWPSDEDRGKCVAKPGIDIIAAAYIDKRHKEFELETVKPDGKAE
ncbi:hypothetical protein PS2_032969 [Malus domestica]